MVSKELLVRMPVIGATGARTFLTATACRNETKETDQKYRTDEGCWGFHLKTLQKKMGEIRR